MRIKFCGAARVVTGSCHLLTLDNGMKILMDCGLYQGRDKDMEDFNASFPFDPKTIDIMVLSHAHIDHTGRIPKLVKDGFDGDILCTHATRSLAGILLQDSARIQERDASYHNKKFSHLGKKTALYNRKDARKALDNFIGLSYDRWHFVCDGVRLLFKDAGHLLGSASITLEITEVGKEPVLFGFTGDVGRPNRPILRNPIQMPEVDYLICESTYGNRDHVDSIDETDRFMRIITQTCIENKGKLLIPAFSIGRTQEIVYMLDRLETAGVLPHVPVYVDSPLAVNATQIFGAHQECFDEELSEYLLLDPNPFGFSNLNYIRKKEKSKRLNKSKEGCIIVSSSGMMNAGRSKHHLYNSIDDAKNAVMLVGYCAPHTPGGKLKRGAKTVDLFGKSCPVNLDVHVMDSISGHGDRHEIKWFINNQQKLKKIFLVHGEYDSQFAFKSFLEDAGMKNIEIPSLNQEFEL